MVMSLSLVMSVHSQYAVPVTSMRGKTVISVVLSVRLATKGTKVSSFNFFVNAPIPFPIHPS